MEPTSVPSVILTENRPEIARLGTSFEAPYA